MKKVMAFGVFDGIHEGHRHFLKEAKALGDYLIVVVAQDHIVKHLKGHEPQLNLSERFEHLEREDAVDEVIIGDAELSTYEVVKKYRPDVIALGYDQTLLKKDLEINRSQFDWPIDLVTVAAYEPNIYHSSLLADDKEETE